MEREKWPATGGNLAVAFSAGRVVAAGESGMYPNRIPSEEHFVVSRRDSLLLLFTVDSIPAKLPSYIAGIEFISSGCCSWMRLRGPWRTNTLYRLGVVSR